MMALLINRELNEPSTLQGLTARAQRPPLDKTGHALFQAVFYHGKMSIKYQKNKKKKKSIYKGNERVTKTQCCTTCFIKSKDTGSKYHLVVGLKGPACKIL